MNNRPIIPSNLNLKPLAENVRAMKEEKKTVPPQQIEQKEHVQPVQVVQQNQTAQQNQSGSNQQFNEHEILEYNKMMLSDEEFNNIQEDTYLKISSDSTDIYVMEFDLISHRQRGQHKKYMNIRVVGKDEETGSMLQKTNITIENEEQFNVLKSFFSNLDWSK